MNIPSSVSEEVNEELMSPVTLIEIQAIMDLCKNDKSLGPDGIPVEVYQVLFDVLGPNLVKIVGDSRRLGKNPAMFNSTLIALIPKFDLPKSFEDFRPISLCNCIYKFIGKAISIRIKKVLCGSISGEQFGFLPGRQIHETDSRF